MKTKPFYFSMLMFFAFCVKCYSHYDIIVTPGVPYLLTLTEEQSWVAVHVYPNDWSLDMGSIYVLETIPYFPTDNFDTEMGGHEHPDLVGDDDGVRKYSRILIHGKDPDGWTIGAKSGTNANFSCWVMLYKL